VCTVCRHHFDDPIVGEPDSADELVVVDTDGDEEADEADETDGDADTEADPFVWVSEGDLAEPPLRRELRALGDETKTALAIYLYRPWDHTEADPAYHELGYLLGYSRQWVGERVRAWEDGEYRDLVADPRPRVTVAAGAEGVAAE